MGRGVFSKCPHPLIIFLLFLLVCVQGAGKTTLVNYILTKQNEWRIAIIENEFGEVNIDEGLVQEQVLAAVRFFKIGEWGGGNRKWERHTP